MTKYGWFRTISGAVAFAALAAGSAHAQIAQETLDFGVDVELASAPATISGLENMSMKFSTLSLTGAIAETSTAQTFCVFSPTRYFNMSVAGTAKGNKENTFYIEDSTQAGTGLELLAYNVLLHDVFNGGEIPLGPNNGVFFNGTPIMGIDSLPFNSDKTCTDGENLQLTLYVPVAENTGPGGGSTDAEDNYAILSQLVDGQLHSYTDTLTLVVEPAL